MLQKSSSSILQYFHIHWRATLSTLTYTRIGRHKPFHERALRFGWPIALILLASAGNWLRFTVESDFVKRDYFLCFANHKHSTFQVYLNTQYARTFLTGMIQTFASLSITLEMVLMVSVLRWSTLLPLRPSVPFLWLWQVFMFPTLFQIVTYQNFSHLQQLNAVFQQTDSMHSILPASDKYRNHHTQSWPRRNDGIEAFLSWSGNGCFKMLL